MKSIYLKFFLILWTAVSSLACYAQSPEGINYQAALRDSETGNVLENEMVFMVITILEGGPGGIVVYSESHTGVQTNGNGLINLVIGDGDVSEGSFSDIPWSSGNIWYEVELDNGSGLESLGSVKFLSVPYALYAGNAEQSPDDDPTNELITSAEFDAETQSISIDESGNLLNVSLEGLEVDDADADDTNELITSAIYSVENNAIILTQADDSELIISLSDLNVSDDDPDDTNELIDPNFGLQLINDSNLVISEAGISYSVNLGGLIDDDDADITNELIDDESFTLTDESILSISEAGIEHAVNLSALAEDDDWVLDEEQNRVYNESEKIGIGTNEPSARLEVVEDVNSAVALNVVSGEESMIHVANERLGVGTTSPQSMVQFAGSVGYDVTLLQTGESDAYSAGIEDHMIVINFQILGNLDYSIVLPPAVDCEGRVYFIRKTGANAAFGEVIIDTGIFPVDFFTPDLVLDEFSGETAVLLSLGADGWTRILRGN